MKRRKAIKARQEDMWIILYGRHYVGRILREADGAWLLIGAKVRQQVDLWPTFQTFFEEFYQ